MGHWVEQRIRVTARRGACAWFLVLGLVGLAYLANARYFMDFASGAFVASEEDLDATAGSTRRRTSGCGSAASARSTPACRRSRFAATTAARPAAR